MVVRMRLNRSQRDSRRSQQKRVQPALILCADCGARKLPHKVCENCGMYKGRMVIDVNAEIARKERRKQAKRELRGEEASEASEEESKKEEGKK